MLNKTQFSDDFYEKLPKKPYCSDDLGRGVIIRPKRTAIQKPYIQHNPPCLVSSLVFDIDRQDAYFAWSDANLPTNVDSQKSPEWTCTYWLYAFSSSMYHASSKAECHTVPCQD